MNDTTLTAGTIISVIALAFSGISLCFVYFQMRINRKNSYNPVFIHIFKEYRDDVSNSYYYVINEMNRKVKAVMPISRLPEETKTHVRKVVYFFENVSFLVCKNQIAEKLIIDFLGYSLLQSWTFLEPFIQKEREYREEADKDNFYLWHFEHMAKKIVDDDTKKRFSKLKKIDRPSTKLAHQKYKLIAFKEKEPFPEEN